MLATIQNDYIGLKLFDAQMNTLEVTEYSERYKGYLLSENNDIAGKHRLIMQAEEIEFYISKQDQYIQSHKNSLERERQEKERQEQEEQKYNNTYGYTESIKLTPMEKGKLLKTLNKSFNYFENGIFKYSMARKDFIKLMLEQENRLEHKTNVRYYTKNSELKIKANEYRLTSPDNTYYEITKTEYEYGKYLETL